MPFEQSFVRSRSYPDSVSPSGWHRRQHRRQGQNFEGVRATDAIPVLQKHGLKAAEVDVDSMSDLVKASAKGPLMVGGNNGGAVHRVILISTMPGEDGTSFRVLDSLSAGRGETIHIETWSNERFTDFWDKGAPVIKF